MKQFLIAAIFALSLVGCKKNEDNRTADNTDFESIWLFDAEANYLGSQHNASDDYQQEDWPQWVYDAFKPLDTVKLAGYEKSEISIDALYPNPVKDTQTLRVFATQPANLKIVIINTEKNVVYRRSIHVPNAIQRFGFQYDPAIMPGNGIYYRMFYAFSSELEPFFMRGHIDIYKQ